MISPQKIKYATYSSEDKDLICDVAFDSDNGETSAFLSRDAIMSETYNGERQRVSAYKYTEVFAPKVTFVDKNFGDITLDRQRDIMKWLTSKKTPSFLTVYINDPDNTQSLVSYEILGNWTEINTYKLGNGRVVGFTAIFTSVAPWAFSQLETKTINGADLTKYEFKNTDTGVTSQVPNYIQYIDVNSDDVESTIYPRITIQQNTSVIVPVDHAMISGNKWIDDEDWVDGTVYYYAGASTYYYNKHNDDGSTVPTATKTNPIDSNTKTSVVIKNTYIDADGKTQVAKTIIANNTVKEKVILDGANRVVSSWYLGTDAITGQTNVWLQDKSRVFGDSFNWSWTPLYNGKNQIEVIGNCTVTLEYREIRKIGEY